MYRSLLNDKVRRAEYFFMYHLETSGSRLEEIRTDIMTLALPIATAGDSTEKLIDGVIMNPINYYPEVLEYMRVNKIEKWRPAIIKEG